MDAQAKQMQDYWHIPRASLVSSTSSAISSASSSKSSNKSNSNPPTLAQRSAASVPSAAVTAAAAAAVLAAAKRGSRSSQGSSDSNNSTRSAASGSLLLTAANLERFAEIHKKQERQHKLELPTVHGNSNSNSSSFNYNANLALANSSSSSNAKDAVIAIDGSAVEDPNLQYVRTKDLDTVSIASSMHFTMVNGEAGNAKKQKRGLCDRGRQVTVLIISMSTIFLLLIMGMVYALEMRARDMPKS